MSKDEVLELVKNYTYNSNRLREVQEQLAAITPKTTPTYGNLAPSMPSGFSSKTENQSIRTYNLHRKEWIYKAKVDRVRRYIERSGLDSREKALMWWLAGNGRLAAFARREHIGKDNVYKIRDRAVRKIIAEHSPHIVG